MVNCKCGGVPAFTMIEGGGNVYECRIICAHCKCGVSVVVRDILRERAVEMWERLQMTEEKHIENS